MAGRVAQTAARKTTAGEGDYQHKHSVPLRTSDWARLLERYASGGRHQLFVMIAEVAVIEKILMYVELSPQPPPRARRMDMFQPDLYAVSVGFSGPRGVPGLAIVARRLTLLRRGDTLRFMQKVRLNFIYLEGSVAMILSKHDKTLAHVCTAAIIAGCTSFACAQNSAQLPPGYPAKSIRVLVGNAPGGGIDITARSISKKLTDKWGRSFVVDNRPGASGVIAMDLARQAAPDGYTLLVTSGSLIASAMARKKVAFDVRTAYAPVTQLTALYYMLLINPSLPVNSVQALIAYGKRNPGALNYGSSGVGGAGHLGGALLASMADIKMVHVPYKGGGLVLADLIGGQIQLGFTSTISGMPHVRSGRLKGLAVTSASRAKAFPDLPTIAEAGVPGFELINWYGLFAPANVPPAVIALLHRDVFQALSGVDVQAAFAKDGADARPSPSTDAFRRLLAKEVADWQSIVKLPGFAEALR